VKSDVIVIGGGPSGSSVATFLAQRGLRVKLFEKETFPRDHVGESLLPLNYNLFSELGVLEEMKQRFYRKPGVRFLNIDGSIQTTWCFKRVIKGPEHLSFHVFRADFDHMLLKNSAKHGVEVHEGAKVTLADLGDPTMAKVHVRTGDTETVHEARFLIDCSGQLTFLAKQLKDKEPFHGLDRMALNSHWLNVPFNESIREGTLQILHLGGEKLGWIWAIPIVEGRASVGVVLNAKYARDERVRMQSAGEKDWMRALYKQELFSSPVVSNMLKGAHICMPIMINADYSYYTRKKYGSNFAIVGDAAAFLDPIFASGVYIGIKSAHLVAQGVHRHLTAEQNGGMTLDRAYEHIAGGYVMVEKLIRLFYNPDSISFAEVGSAIDIDYRKFELAYTVLHFLLAGDFFENYARYVEFIELLQDARNLEKFKHRIHKERFELLDELCTTVGTTSPHAEMPAHA
jgi:flavin-dependent dehydrogenase